MKLSDAEIIILLALLEGKNERLLKRRAAFLLLPSNEDVVEVLRADLKELDENRALIAKLSLTDN